MTIEFRAAAGASGDDHALTTPAAAKALTCARNRGNSRPSAHRPSTPTATPFACC